MKVTAYTLYSSCLCSILMISYAATDTITANQTFSDGETIISAHGEFEMGFFSPLGRPQNRYFGIWYRKISRGTVVWVANRKNPINNTSSGIIRAGSRGVMLSTNESTDSIVWSSNYSRSVKNPVAQLLDTGNLVIRDENHSEQDKFVWQSFDYPADNLLPGMKFGVDLVSGMNRNLTPWTSDDNPSPGNFIYRLDPNGYPQLLLWKDSILWYRTGPWVASTGTSGLPSLKSNGVYTSNFVINHKEIYYTTNLVNTSESVITRLILLPSGYLQRLLWNRHKEEWTIYLTLQVSDCDRYGYCGTNGVCNMDKYPRCECMRGFKPKNPEDWAAADWSNGCTRDEQLKCGNGDGFFKYSGVKLPDTRWSWYNTSMDLAECEMECLKNCNCTAYSNTNATNENGCMLWFGGLIDTRGYSKNAENLYVKLAASELRNRGSTQKKRAQIILIFVFAAITVLLCFLWSFAFKKRWLKRIGLMRPNDSNNLDLPLFDFIHIANATNNFSNNNKIGEGGFGSVYKGRLEEGQEIAVKRLSKDSRQGVEEFMNEVSCIAKLQHRNLVRLLGCCIDGGERLLIYEYMPNKSLDFFIFDKELCKSFDWSKRFNIIKGIARGLLYLHQDSRLRIIHRDLKTSNILLDFEMNPKISDFGLARIFGESETQASTTRVVGTFGYMPPEYAMDGLFSVKSDVYSFGVLLLEIISGKRNRCYYHPEHNLNLTGHVWRSFNEGNLADIVDSMILESSNEHEVFRAIQIGLLCVQEYPGDRPNMSVVYLMLTSNDALPRPKQPGFFSERRNPCDTDASPSNGAASTPLNHPSISFFAPRS